MAGTKRAALDPLSGNSSAKKSKTGTTPKVDLKRDQLEEMTVAKLIDHVLSLQAHIADLQASNATSSASSAEKVQQQTEHVRGLLVKGIQSQMKVSDRKLKGPTHRRVP
jgi:hypothetical protein